jgi:uncharacterized protein YjdB
MTPRNAVRRTCLTALSGAFFVACDQAPTETAPPAPQLPAVLVTAGNGLTAYTLGVGETVQLTASLASPGNKPRAVQWSSRNNAVAVVSNTGLVTGVGVGATYVIASNGPRSDSAKITVTGAAQVDSVEITPASASLTIGGTQQFAVTLRSAGQTVSGIPVAWSSTNTNVVTVNADGLATGVAQGSAFVQACAEGVCDAATVTVAQAAVATITVSPSSASVSVGSTQQYTATLRDANGNTLTGRAVAWSSSNETVATVSSSGLVTAVSAGSSTIMASSEGKDGTASLTVTAPSCTLVTDWNARTQPSLTKPGYLQSVTDPTFGTRITRITGDVGSAIPTVGGSWPSVAKHNYAKDPVWNADQTLMVLKDVENGSNQAYFLDGTTYQVLFRRYGPPSGGEWRWHPTKADTVVALASDGSVHFWNPRTGGDVTKVAAVSGYTSNAMGPNEGNLSYDGAYLVAKAFRSSDGHLVARVLNVSAGTVGVVIDLNAAGIASDSLDWVSISAGGDYVVAYGGIGGVGQRVKVWDRASGALVGYWTDNNFGHFDLARTSAGTEIAFGAVAQGTNGKKFVTRALSSGTLTVESPQTSYNWHASSRNLSRADWGYAATNDASGPVSREIYAIKTDGSVQRYAHHRAVNQSYNEAPFPVPSPDGRRVVFSSNWDTAGGAIQTYVMDTRSLCPNGLPQ